MTPQCHLVLIKNEFELIEIATESLAFEQHKINFKSDTVKSEVRQR